jgi:hypothetical protein
LFWRQAHSAHFEIIVLFLNHLSGENRVYPITGFHLLMEKYEAIPAQCQAVFPDNKYDLFIKS